MLKIISIDELKPGMFVEAIAEQQGKAKIKNSGRVTSDSVIAQLKKQGILSLIVDLSRQADTLPVAKKINTDSGRDASPDPAQKNASFDEEIDRAKAIYEQGRVIQKRMLNQVKIGLPLDLAQPEQFIRNLLASMERNPNALLCLTRVRRKEHYLVEHALNVAILLAYFGKHIPISPDKLPSLAMAGFLHDLGKAKVPEQILLKPGKLNELEMEAMRSHVIHSVDTLRGAGFSLEVQRAVAEHHERLDGLGYPKGLREDNISFLGKMLAIVDTYDAITADRCYKSCSASQTAHKILLKNSVSQFDHTLVQKFIKCMGIYPVGSLVKLSNDQIAMVFEQRQQSPLQPKVKVFYSLRSQHYLPSKELALSEPGSQVKIEKAVLANDFGLDFNRFFNETVAA